MRPPCCGVLPATLAAKRGWWTEAGLADRNMEPAGPKPSPLGPPKEVPERAATKKPRAMMLARLICAMLFGPPSPRAVVSATGKVYAVDSGLQEISVDGFGRCWIMPPPEHGIPPGRLGRRRCRRRASRQNAVRVEPLQETSSAACGGRSCCGSVLSRLPPACDEELSALCGFVRPFTAPFGTCWNGRRVDDAT